MGSGQDGRATHTSMLQFLAFLFSAACVDSSHVAAVSSVITSCPQGRLRQLSQQRLPEMVLLPLQPASFWWYGLWL